MTIGERIKSIRTELGFTQSELAKHLDVGTSTIGMYESGKRYPSRDIEEKLASLFNISISDLRGIESDDDPEIAKDAVLLLYEKKFLALSEEKQKHIYSLIDLFSN